MKIKISEAKGSALDWAVAKCEDHEIESLRGGAVWYWLKCSLTGALEVVEVFKPSTDWSQGGPIIEREWLDVTPWPNESNEDMRWQCKQHDTTNGCTQYGQTPLIAAMRCYVASKLGEEVEVPDEIVS